MFLNENLLFKSPMSADTIADFFAKNIIIINALHSEIMRTAKPNWLKGKVQEHWHVCEVLCVFFRNSWMSFTIMGSCTQCLPGWRCTQPSALISASTTCWASQVSLSLAQTLRAWQALMLMNNTCKRVLSSFQTVSPFHQYSLWTPHDFDTSALKKLRISYFGPSKTQKIKLNDK